MQDNQIETYLKIENNPDLVGRISITPIKNVFNSEIDIIFAESKKIFYHVGDLFGYKEYQDCLTTSIQNMSQFLLSKKESNLLFSPFHSPKLQLKNRWVMAPMTRSKSPNGVPTEDVLRYYQSRAKHECGLIITEGVEVEHQWASGYPDVPHMYGSESLKMWKKIVSSVHEYGAKIVPQIWHVGCINKEKKLPIDYSLEEICKVQNAYVQAAKNAKECGFDGIEIHGAHGYLIDQFFYSKTNQRTDHYNGSIFNRTRFACEIIQKIKEALGEDFLIILRFSQWKIDDYEAKMLTSYEELKEFLIPLEDAGVDIFHASNRKFWSCEFPDRDPKRNLSSYVKEITQLPVITVGSFLYFTENTNVENECEEQLKLAQKLLEEKGADLFAVGRAFLGEPCLIEKIKNKQFSSIKPYTKEVLKELLFS